MPILWNTKVVHLLGNNYNLAKRILLSQFKKFQDSPDKLKMIDRVFKEQLEMGIIERVPSPETIPETYPGFSYLAHMPIFRPEKVSSPCRVVFLSNLNGKGASIISHNQAMLSGPSLNRKLSTALLSLRFNKFLLCFDLKKAFLQIELNEIDQFRLLFLWFHNIDKGDYSLVTYKNVRLSFGLRCSPTILMLALYHILIIDTDDDSLDLVSLKRQIYHLIYMDNGAISANSVQKLHEKYNQLNSIFNPYCFELQQFVTNDDQLQNRLDSQSEEGSTPEVVKLLGIKWDRTKDLLFTNSIRLNIDAKTKRQILKSIAEHFDPYGFNLPILNRARLFLHELQMDKSIGWDTILNHDRLHEWQLIAKQVNNSKPLEIPRLVGSSSDSYNLIAFTDSSKEIYGVTLYLHNLRTNGISFLMSKNRVVTRQLSTKSIPTLEFTAITLGAELLIDTYKELTGVDCMERVKINELHLYTDSFVALNWCNQHLKLDKMRNLSVFTMNRLQKIIKLCEVKPIVFKFVNGKENPADCVTRPMSARQLERSNFLTGPKFLTKSESELADRQDLLEVRLPDPNAKNSEEENIFGAFHNTNAQDHTNELEFYDFILHRYSTYKTIFNCYMGMFRFINKLKSIVKTKQPERFQSLKPLNEDELHNFVSMFIFSCDQKLTLTDIHDYFNKPLINKKDIPPLVSQLNLYRDQNGIIKVNSKFSRNSVADNYKIPVLIARKSRLAELLVNHYHEDLSHANRFTVLSEIKKKIWIPRSFSLVKTATKNCFHCQRYHNRTIKINQNKYREFREMPPCTPFQSVFLDHAGHFEVNMGENKIKKVWVLVITCLWSRAVNLELCYDLSTDAFLQALQMHIFHHGLPETVLSDMGCQIVAADNKINSYILNDSEVHRFFKYNNIKVTEFEQYFKGRHELGSLVEVCVKMSKRLIFGSVRNLILSIHDFTFNMKQTVSIINRRPVAFREQLVSSEFDMPEVITPEQLIYGRTLTSMNIIPEMYPAEITNFEKMDSDHPTAFDKLNKARNRLIKIYHDEFIQTLLDQATNQTRRYQPKKHHKLCTGDIVLLKEPLLKPNRYPLGRVTEVFENELEEVTQIKVLKGDTGQILKRHVTSIIPVLTKHLQNTSETHNPVEENPSSPSTNVQNRKSQRLAAVKGRKKTQDMIDEGLV